MGTNISNNKNKNRQVKNSAENYFMKAEKLRTENKYKEAAENYLKSVFINRNNPNSYLGLGITYKNLKNYSKAITHLKKAQELTPLNCTIHKELALCSIINGDFEEGIKYLITSIKLEPNNPDIQMQLALVHEMIEEEDMALMIYQRIIEMYPDYLRAYIQKATLYMHLEDYLNCAKLFKQIIKLAPKYYRAYLAIGICYEKLGNYLGAKRYYKNYLKYNKNADNYNEIAGRINENYEFKKNSKTKLKLIQPI